MNEVTSGVEMGTADVLDIMRMIPHRYPMLMIDRVVDMVANSSATGIKNVTIGEPYFRGHFPVRPVMPGVMIVESMAQTAAVLVVYTLGAEAQGKLVYFMTIDKARFRRPVSPGDTMRIYVSKEQSRGNVWRFNGDVKVEGTRIADANFSAIILDD
jgi:3-hydroxyacyl-[acyl-carrier-protein] dehydratase